jgi:hypothetical protein
MEEARALLDEPGVVRPEEGHLKREEREGKEPKALAAMAW